MPVLDHEQTARLAYQLWEERGRPFGSPDVDWWRAEAQLEAAGRAIARITTGSLPLEPDEGPWHPTECEPARER